MEAGNVDCDTYKSAKSFRIPVTYRVPLKGFELAADDLAAGAPKVGGDSLVVPNPKSLTRKEILDDLCPLNLPDA